METIKTPKDNKTIASEVDSIHICLCNINATLLCIAEAVYHMSGDGCCENEPKPEDVYEALRLIVKTMDDKIIPGLCLAVDDIRLGHREN